MDWDTLTFDCYGTLVDWEAGIVRAFRREAARDGVELEAARIVAAYHGVEAAVEAGPYRRYRAVLGEAALRVAERLGWRLEPERAGFLADSLPDWPVFPDTRPALKRLRPRFRLAILSNVDDDLLEATLERIGVRFDWAVTAQRVGSYKPARGHFEEAVRRVGGRAERLLHVAQSRFHDIEPAGELGLATVWVNRKGEAVAGGRVPLRVVADLAELADWLGV